MLRVAVANPNGFKEAVSVLEGAILEGVRQAARFHQGAIDKVPFAGLRFPLDGVKHGLRSTEERHQ